MWTAGVFGHGGNAVTVNESYTDLLKSLTRKELNTSNDMWAFYISASSAIC